VLIVPITLSLWRIGAVMAERVTSLPSSPTTMTALTSARSSTSAALPLRITSLSEPR
jgi:hypothetical protein